MIFLAPWMLGLFALGGAIWLLHMRHRQSLEVSSLLIWQRIGARRDRKRTSSWLPRLNLLLILQMLILFCLVVALARPLWGANRDVDHWIYVLENSAAMQVHGASGLPLEEARAVLAERLATPDPSARSSLLVAGGTARALFADRAAGQRGLDDALSTLFPEHGAPDWTGTGRLIAALTRPDEVTRVVLLTTSGAPDNLVGAAQDVMAFSSDAPNAGLAVRLDEPTDDGLLHGEGQIQFLGGMDETVLTISHRDTVDAPPRLLAETTITLSDPAVGIEPFAFSIPAPPAGLVTLSLVEDAAAFDNRADVALSERAASLDILYLAPADAPLAQALRAVEGTRVTLAPALPADADTYDLVVADGLVLDRAPQTNRLWIGTARLSSDPEPGVETGERTIPGWRRTHPLSADSAWQTLRPDQIVTLPPRADAEILVGNPDQVMLDLRSGEAGLDIRMGFDPAQSNWPDTPDIVVFAQALVTLIAPQTGSRIGPVCVVGAPCLLAAQWAGGTLSPRDHEGPTLSVGEAFVPTSAGLFTLSRGETQIILPVHAPPLATQRGQGGAISGDLAPRPLVLAPWFAGLAVLLLVVEGVLAHRRRTLSLPLAYGPRALAILLALLAITDLHLPWRVDQALVRIAPQSGEEAVETTYLAHIDHNTLAVPGDPEAVIGLALASLEPQRPARLLLDGVRLSTRDMGSLASGLSQVPVDHIAPTSNGDLFLAALDAPERLYAGDEFSLSVLVGADRMQAATLDVWREDELVLTTPLDLQPGLNRHDVAITDLAAGPVTFRATIRADGDPQLENNSLGLVRDVRPAGHVALLSGQAGRGAGFATLLAEQGFAPEVLDVADSPETAEGWQGFDALVLMNQPASALTTDQQRAIETAVREHGMGLLIAGGPNSFGPGGYLETPLDLVSPISSKVPRDKPGVALVFVLDRSSSMGQMVGPLTRLDIAKQATLAAIRLLDEDSQVSVVTFDSAARLALPLTSVEQMGFIERSVNQISLGGGTAMQRGLSTGYAQIRNTDAAARHIIVMTDGLSQPSDYSVLMRSLNAASITVSTVAIGEEADRELVEWLAEEGGGLFHATTDFEALPSILSQEAMRLSGDGFEEGPAQPYWLDREPGFLAGLADIFDPIEGYVLTTAKPEAQMLAMVEDTTGQPVPLLSYWQYGLGQVLALTTDIAGNWSESWQARDDYPLLYVQALQAFLPTTATGPRLTLSRNGDSYSATLDTGQPGPMPALVVEGEPSSLPVTARALGQFHASIAPEHTGPLRVSLSGTELAASGYANYPQALNPSAFRNATPDLTAHTGGMVVAAASSYAPPAEAGWVQRPAALVWLGAALALFIFDLIIRYSGRFRLRRNRAPEPTQETMA